MYIYVCGMCMCTYVHVYNLCGCVHDVFISVYVCMHVYNYIWHGCLESLEWNGGMVPPAHTLYLVLEWNTGMIQLALILCLKLK